MRRLFLILLLLMMPLQSAWAAGAVYCSHDEATMHPGHHVHKHPPSNNQDDGAPGEHCNDCDACHHLTASAVLSAQPNLALPKGAPHLRGELRRYASHVADLVPPPIRRSHA